MTVDRLIQLNRTSPIYRNGIRNFAQSLDQHQRAAFIAIDPAVVVAKRKHLVYPLPESLQHYIKIADALVLWVQDKIISFEDREKRDKVQQFFADLHKELDMNPRLQDAIKQACNTRQITKIASAAEFSEASIEASEKGSSDSVTTKKSPVALNKIFNVLDQAEGKLESEVQALSDAFRHTRQVILDLKRSQEAVRETLSSANPAGLFKNFTDWQKAHPPTDDESHRILSIAKELAKKTDTSSDSQTVQKTKRVLPATPTERVSKLSRLRASLRSVSLTSLIPVGTDE